MKPNMTIVSEIKSSDRDDVVAKLRALAESNPNELAADEHLRELSTEAGVPLGVVRKQYQDACRKRKQKQRQAEKEQAERQRRAAQQRRLVQQVFGPDNVLEALNEKCAVVQYANRVLILVETHDPVLQRATFVLISAADFRLKYRNRTVLVPTERGPVSKTWADIWLEHPRRRQYEGVVFIPGEAPPAYYNLWQGFAREPKVGCCERLKQHLLEVICQSDANKFDYLWRWCAHLVQHPEQLPGVAIVLRSKQGTGKNTFVDALGAIFGRHYVVLNQSGLLCGRFTAHLTDVILVFANEAVWGGDKQGEGRLKAMITDPVETVEAKGKDAVSVPNYKRVIVASNEHWAIPRGIDDRRFFCLDVADHRIGDHYYFDALHAEIRNGGIEALLAEWQAVDISNWRPSHNLPKGHRDGEDIKLESLSSPLKFWHYCLSFARNMPSDDDDYGHDHDWYAEVETEVLYHFYLGWCDNQRITHRADPARFGQELRRALPGLKKVRPRGTTGRRQCYHFPDIDSARQAFQEHIADVTFDD